MTMPHLMNCDHSDDWCLDCVKKLHDECEAVKQALTACRTSMRENGVTTRQFAALCGISPTKLSEWTSSIPDTPPDIICRR